MYANTFSVLCVCAYFCTVQFLYQQQWDLVQDHLRIIAEATGTAGAGAGAGGAKGSAAAGAAVAAPMDEEWSEEEGEMAVDK
jgi:hypothetical protein